MKRLTEEINDPKTGKLIVFGARPGMGLNRICLQLANELAKSEKVLYIRGEDFVSALRLLKFSILPRLQVDSNIAKDPLSFFYELERIMHQENYNWIVIDDLSRIFYTITEAYREERDRIISKLKRLILKYPCSLIISVPLSEEVELRSGYKRPYLSDFNWSYNLTSLGDSLYAVYIPLVYGITEDELGRPTDKFVQVICRKHPNKLPHSIELFGDPFDVLKE